MAMGSQTHKALVTDQKEIGDKIPWGWWAGPGFDRQACLSVFLPRSLPGALQKGGWGWARVGSGKTQAVHEPCLVGGRLCDEGASETPAERRRAGHSSSGTESREEPLFNPSKILFTSL